MHQGFLLFQACPIVLNLSTFHDGPTLADAQFTLIASVRVVVTSECIDFMAWGNQVDLCGQRVREFGLRDGCLEYGQWHNHSWSAVRATARIDDGVWHRVAVVKRQAQALLFVDGAEVASRPITNDVHADDVHDDFYSARFRTPPGEHDWFSHGAIKNIVIYDKAVTVDAIFLVWY